MSEYAPRWKPSVYVSAYLLTCAASSCPFLTSFRRSFMCCDAFVPLSAFFTSVSQLIVWNAQRKALLPSLNTSVGTHNGRARSLLPKRLPAFVPAQNDARLHSERLVMP